MAHQQSHPNYPSSSRSLHSQVTDAVSVTRDKFTTAISAIQKPATRNGLKDSWDSLVKVMFAPCAGDIGGIPRDEMMGTPPRSSASRTGSRAGSNNIRGTAPPPPAFMQSVPFEVSASQQEQDRSLLQGDTSMQSSPQHYPLQEQRAQTPREQRNARSRAKLRQLGARHQLAGGFPGESLADTARPISPRAEEHLQEECVDFDDGISAISSHTLEEMERRRLIKDKKNVVRLHPMDFSQIIEEDVELNYGNGGLDLVEEEDEKNTEVVFGEPFYEEGLVKQVSNEYPTQELASRTEMNRVTSIRTHQTQNTTITEESHEFEDMYRRHEAMYWTDQDQVANGERSDSSRRLGRQQTRTTQGMSIEERARRLRELSRSRSRSDGTGSSNKSGTSSLASGQHPHDTMPVYSSDLFPRRKKSTGSASGSGYRKYPRTHQHDEFVPGSRASASVMEDSDPFASLDYGEI